MAPDRIKTNFPPSVTKHTSRPSQETNASAITGSAISFSAFPEPPSSIPPTPHSLITPGRVPRSFYTQQLEFLQAAASRRVSRSTFGGETSKPSSSQRHERDNDVTSVTTSNISPYDWHEGASSIDVDAAEDRLLPTSFITSLLQESVGPRGANRTSQFSGFSEMTYPPRNPHIDSLHSGSVGLSSNSLQGQFPSRQSYRGLLPRPAGGRAHGSTQIHRPVSHDHKSGSHTNHNQVISGSERVLHTEQPEVCGESDDVIHLEVQTNASSTIALHPTEPTQQLSAPNINNRLRRQRSMLSTRSATPSFVSRISSLRSLQRLITWRRKPLPPVPTFPQTLDTTERVHQGGDESTPLPDLVGRANQLHTLLEKGYHPHQSLFSHQTKSEAYVSSFDDAETIAPLRKKRDFQPLSSSRHSHVISWAKSHKRWVALGIFIVITIITVGSAVGVTTQRRKTPGTSCPSEMVGAGCNLSKLIDLNV
jgi:hypothetical protein